MTSGISVVYVGISVVYVGIVGIYAGRMLYKDH